jgi:hypothetical protein
MFPIMSQMILSIYFRCSKILSLHLCLGLPEFCNSHLSYACYTLQPTHPPWLDHPANICGTVQIMDLLVRFHVLTETGMKMAVFWDVAPCSLVDTDRHFRGAYCLQHRTDNGGSKVLWNVGQYLPDYTAQHRRRQPSSMVISSLRDFFILLSLPLERPNSLFNSWFSQALNLVQWVFCLERHMFHFYPRLNDCLLCKRRSVCSSGDVNPWRRFALLFL